jgi:hypothetical protein
MGGIPVNGCKAVIRCFSGEDGVKATKTFRVRMSKHDCCHFICLKFDP